MPRIPLTKSFAMMVDNDSQFEGASSSEVGSAPGLGAGLVGSPERVGLGFLRDLGAVPVDLLRAILGPIQHVVVTGWDACVGPAGKLLDAYADRKIEKADFLAKVEMSAARKAVADAKAAGLTPALQVAAVRAALGSLKDAERAAELSERTLAHLSEDADLSRLVTVA